MYITRQPNKIYIPSEVFDKIKTNTIIEIIFMGCPKQKMDISLVKGIVVTERTMRMPMSRVAHRLSPDIIEETISGTLKQWADGNLIIDSMRNLKD